MHSFSAMQIVCKRSALSVVGNGVGRCDGIPGRYVLVERAIGGLAERRELGPVDGARQFGHRSYREWLSANIEYLGYSGTGRFMQSGGTNSVGGTYDLRIGVNSGGNGSYNLGGSGYLAVFAVNEVVGYNGTGSFMQSGGTNSLGNSNLILAYNYGTTGSYTLSGSGYLSAHSEFVGYYGIGTFTQSGGTNVIANELDLGVNSSGSGSYTLNGGLLALGQRILRDSGSASFNFGGGTLGAVTSWSTAINMALTGSGGTATIDTTGGNITLLAL